MEPCRGLRLRGKLGGILRIGCWLQLAENCRSGEAHRRIAVQFDGEEPFMHDVTEPVHNTRPVEIDAHRVFRFHGVIARAIGQSVLGLGKCMPPQRLEEWMPWSNPFEVVFVCDFYRSKTVDT